MTAPSPEWPLAALQASPWCMALRPALAQLRWPQFPIEADWANLPDTLRPRTQTGHPIHFVSPEALDDENYEQRIARTGQVATRIGNWHDAFNALCWLAWPRTKAALNALHLREMAAQGDSQRSRRRDTATLFDESGVVLACADATLADALLVHDWHQLFCQRREAWGRHVGAWVFGHALLEKSLSPFIGIVGKVIVIPVNANWFTQPLSAQLAVLDDELAARFNADALSRPSDMPPLPVLGIPGWWPDQDATFYADAQHFRPKRTIAIRPA